MAQDRKTTKQRMVTAAAQSLRRHGVAGTAFTEVLQESGAARGAIYHHFPGGKVDLVEAAVAATGAEVTAALDSLPPATDEIAVLAGFFGLVRPVVAESAAGAGCAIAAVVTETGRGDQLHRAAADVLDGWRAVLADRLRQAGASAQRADELASLMLITLEGAHILCRASGDIAPFDRAVAALLATVDSAGV